MSSPPLCNLGTTSTFNTRPDNKMGRELPTDWNSASKRAAKHNASKKRRQRDKKDE